MMKEQFTPGDWVNSGDEKDMTFGTIIVGPASIEFDRGDDESYKQAMRDADLIAVSKKMFRVLVKLAYLAETAGSKYEAEVINKILAEARGEKSDTA